MLDIVYSHKTYLVELGNQTPRDSDPHDYWSYFPSSAETGIYQEKWVNVLAANALAPFVVDPAAVMILPKFNKQSPVNRSIIIIKLIYTYINKNMYYMHINIWMTNMCVTFNIRPINKRHFIKISTSLWWHNAHIVMRIYCVNYNSIHMWFPKNIWLLKSDNVFHIFMSVWSTKRHFPNEWSARRPR